MRWLEFVAQSMGEGEAHREKKLASSHLQYYTAYKQKHAHRDTREDREKLPASMRRNNHN